MDFSHFVPENMTILVMGLYIIGTFLKASPKAQDWLIPWVLLVISIVASIGMNVVGNPLSGNLVVSAILQGIICTGTAVLGNQLYKQTKEKGQA